LAHGSWAGGGAHASVPTIEIFPSCSAIAPRIPFLTVATEARRAAWGFLDHGIVGSAAHRRGGRQCSQAWEMTLR
jgi:hypothetical protein